MKICKTCKKQFTRQGNKGRGKYFCSPKCKRHTKSTKEKLSKLLLNNKRAIGHKLSDDAKIKMITKKKGQKLSLKSRKLLSNARKNEWATGQRKGGWKHSNETRKKMSEMRKRENLSTETINKLRNAMLKRWNKTKRKKSKMN